MMKKLLKNLTLILVFSTAMLSFGQIEVEFTDPGITIDTNGTLSSTTSFTVKNIPKSITNTFLVRVYEESDNESADYNVQGTIHAQDSYPLNSDTPDSNNGIYSYVDVDNGSTIDRTFTITSISTDDSAVGSNVITSGTSYAITLRFAQAGPGGNNEIAGGFNTTSTPMAIPIANPVKHYLYELNIMDVTLGLHKPNKIEGALVSALDGSITVKGANLDAVYTITGQKVGTTNLAKGIYIVKISKENKVDTIKIAL